MRFQGLILFIPVQSSPVKVNALNLAVCLFFLRLDEASKRLQRERRHKLHDWEERLTSVDSFLRKAERETERLEPVGDDLETVRRQHDDFEVYKLTKTKPY